MTPIVVWFYINMLYFPYNAQDLAKVSFEEFAQPIFDSLERVADITGENVRFRPALLAGNEDSAERSKNPLSQSA